MAEPGKIKTATVSMAASKEQYQAPTTSVRSNREARHNTGAGLTKAQKEALAKEENRLGARTRSQGEEIVVVDTKGNVNPLGSPTIRAAYHKRGNREWYEAQADMTRVPKDSVVTHNHPGFASTDGTIAGGIGNTFSTQDIKTAVGSDLKEIRARANGYTYSLKRPAGGWPTNFYRVFAQEVNREEFEVKSYIYRTKGEMTDKYKKTANARLNLMSRHRALKRVAAKYGVSYTWHKNS